MNVQKLTSLGLAWIGITLLLLGLCACANNPTSSPTAVSSPLTLPPPTIPSAPTSPPAALARANTDNQPLLEWEGYIPMNLGDDSKCKFLEVAADHTIHIGYCQETSRDMGIIRQDMILDMVAHFAPFEYKTDKDKLVFRGTGQVADPIWHEAILKWVRQTYVELASGHVCASCNTVFTWSLGQIPGHAGKCKLVYVLAWGYATAGTVPCQGGNSQDTHTDWLTTDEWQKLNTLTNNGAIAPDTVNWDQGTRIQGDDKLTTQLQGWTQTVYERLLHK